MDVINLVSSDEEDKDDGVKSKIKSNKNLSVKKVRAPKVSHHVKDIPMQKITPPVVHQRNNNTKQVTVIQAFKQQNQQSATPLPTNQLSQTPLRKNQQSSTSLPKSQQSPTVVLKNHHTSTLLLKDPLSPTPLLKSPQTPQRRLPDWMVNTVKVRDVKPAENKTPTLNLASGITITPVSRSAVIANNHANSTVSHVGSITTIKPRTENSTFTPKPIVTTVVDIQPVTPINAAISKPAKRVVPTKISDTVTMRASSIEKSSDSDMLSRDSSSVANDDITPTNSIANGTNKTEQDGEPKAKRPKTIEPIKNPMHKEYVQLIEVCKSADPTEDMKKIIAKLVKYYHKAHAAYVNSKSFRKLVASVTEEIKAKPKLVCLKINTLLEEMRTRKATTESTTEHTEEKPKMTEAEEKKAKKIQKLSEALKKLQWRIRKCEEAEVDWEDELNSKYLETERYKKRAWEIYEKLCDLTGESRSAERIVKKPFKFNGTSYPEFNRKLEKFINETKAFPDMFDVLRIMDHCVKQYNYRMSKELRKTVAQEAFHEVGTQLQKRRKADLYEMVQYFAANHNDPAGEDPLLKSKLEENQRHGRSRMKEVIERYTRNHSESEMNEEEEEDSPVKVEPNRSVINVRPPPVSPHLLEPMPDPPELNLDADIDLLNDSVQFISDSGEFNDISKTDSILIDDQDAADELEQQFLPTITSVTSLHPSEFNNLMNFEMTSSQQLESAEIS